MKKIYQNPSILVLEMETSELICQSAKGGVAGDSMEKFDTEEMVKSNNYNTNPVQWEDWQ